MTGGTKAFYLTANSDIMEATQSYIVASCMKTVFIEYLDLKSKEKQEKIMMSAVYHIMDFDELISDQLRILKV